MFDSISRRAILAVADNKKVCELITRYGMASSTGFARRFVAGETLDEAVEAVKKLNEKGIAASLDLLGESVSNIDETREARDQIIEALDRIHETGINTNVSIKLTQLGLDLSTDICLENVKTIVLRARKYNNWVRIDMEDSPFTQRTIDIFQYLFERVSNNVGIVLQSYLYRTEFDVHTMNKLGARVRLCKGAYREPETVAYRKKKFTDLNFAKCMEFLFANGIYPAIGTHDEKLINKAKEIVENLNIPRDNFEFQMLYGIRRDLQRQLVKNGYRLRVYVPFGTEWYPYFSRRLGERIGNVKFILKSLYLDTSDSRDSE